MRALTEPEDYPVRSVGSITLQMLKETKRPIGFARDWPEEPPKKQKKHAKRV